jgi:ribulose-5-phosphate 4-epimerase/fuculose-1-phosphate aldolase
MKPEHELLEIGRILVQKTLAVSSSGNLSMRVGGRILYSPTGISLGELKADALAETDIEGNRIGSVSPTKECMLHLAIYRRYAGARVIIHVHPAHTIAVASSLCTEKKKYLPSITPQYVMRAGRVPVLPYAAPGSEKLAGMVERCETRSAIALQNHGVIVFAGDFKRAMGILEEIEENCRICLLAGSGARFLSEDEINALEK